MDTANSFIHVLRERSRSTLISMLIWIYIFDFSTFFNVFNIVISTMYGATFLLIYDYFYLLPK